MTNATLWLMLLFQAYAPAIPAAPPGEAGIWMLRNGNWLPMPPAPVAAVKTAGFDNYIYTNGYSNLDMNVSFVGAGAALRISDREPVFTARPDDGGFEPVLIRLEKKKDRRVCRTQPSSATTDNKLGLRKQDIVRTILTANNDKSFTVRPERPLKPGEYLLVTGSPSLGRDFGVD